MLICFCHTYFNRFESKKVVFYIKMNTENVDLFAIFNFHNHPLSKKIFRINVMQKMIDQQMIFN